MVSPISNISNRSDKGFKDVDDLVRSVILSVIGDWVVEKEELKGINRDLLLRVVEKRLYESQGRGVKSYYDRILDRLSGLINDLVISESVLESGSEEDVFDRSLFIKKVDKQLRRNSLAKALVKSVRADLRRVFGLFKRKGVGSTTVSSHVSSQVTPLAASLNSRGSSSIIDVDLLKKHQSTAERVSFYEFFFDEVVGRAPWCEAVLDLGCGYNPYAAPLLARKLGRSIDYYAVDIDDEELLRICSFLNDNSLIRLARCESRDLVRDHDFFLSLKNDSFSDKRVVFALKLFDTLEGQKKNITRVLIPLIKDSGRLLVASFAGRSISGKAIDWRRRAWFEKLLTREGISFDRLLVGDEQVYFCQLR